MAEKDTVMNDTCTQPWLQDTLQEHAMIMNNYQVAMGNKFTLVSKSNDNRSSKLVPRHNFYYSR